MVTSNPKKLLKTLNPKQQAYVNLNLPDPRNGEYLLAVFHLVSGGKLNILLQLKLQQNLLQVQHLR